MHIEFLIEDWSGKTFLETILPKIFELKEASWRVHGYKGIGRIPTGLKAKSDPTKRIILDQLPRLLAGFGRTPYVDAVVVVVDTDTRDCKEFLEELKKVAKQAGGPPKVMFRLAIEELEAWYFGDPDAVEAAYGNVNRAIMRAYVQDSVCGTWERLADAITPGGSAKISGQAWPAAGVLKSEWATKIPPHMDVERNTSPSFVKLRDGIRSIVTQ